VIDLHGVRRDIAFKGSGKTPFGRRGDGKAAVGPMLREVLISEAMHALGIPTTRALAVAATGEPVYRERVLPGAVLTRVAASHIRVGTFQLFASRGDVESVRKLAEYTIARHDPQLAGAPDRFLALLAAVVARQASLLAQWMNVGFIHGVMNTDNMTLSGETIDYGPCAFVEAYDPKAVFSSIDEYGRYAFGNQPDIALWNLTRLAETLLPLIDDDTDRAVERATAVLATFAPQFHRHMLRIQRAKLGLREPQHGPQHGAKEEAQRAAHDEADRLPDPEGLTTAPDELAAADAALVADWLSLLHAQKVDFTLAWRRLAAAATGDDASLRALFADAAPLDAWLVRWRGRCAFDDRAAAETSADRANAVVDAAATARADRMRRLSPAIIPRNHRVEEALTAASDRNDLEPFERLLDVVRRPFDPALDASLYADPAPADVTACYQTFCGT